MYQVTPPLTRTLSLQGRGKSMSPRPSGGGKLILPADQGGGPGQAASDRCQADQIACFHVARPHRRIQCQRERGGGGIPVLFDQTEHARRLDTEPLPHLLQQPPVGLMKDEPIDISDSQPMLLQRLAHRHLQTAHRHSKQAGPPHVDRMESFRHCLLGRRQARAARGDLDQLRMGAI